MEVDDSENIAISLSPSNHNSNPSDATLRMNAVNESLGEEKSEVSDENFEMKTKMSAGLKSSKCGQCPRKFPEADNLQKNPATHAGSRPFSFHICNKSSILPESLTGILSHNLV
ncbi:hypothetical protein JTB14_034632 [Gonioctena quinquepunctata]|nr:hypothetical protein JTB14_034632 [Gonioctena quinquepunctata]